MSRDQQIGLAMGILLVGAVSAFFFRHEDPPARKLPSLKTAADLDRAIAERQHVPYLPEEERESVPTIEQSRVESLETAEGGLVPEPIAVEGEIAAAALVSTQSTIAAPSRVPIHIVRNGDTLSSIALQHLGSTARYQEVFEANRDRLRTPNDLRIGQELRIPHAGPVATAPNTVPRVSQNDKPLREPTESAAPPSTPDGATKFMPYRSSPLTPGQGGESAPSPATGGKRLSQLPPKGDTVIR
jgi:LysM repeat protein